MLHRDLKSGQTVLSFEAESALNVTFSEKLEYGLALSVGNKCMMCFVSIVQEYRLQYAHLHWVIISGYHFSCLAKCTVLDKPWN